jgi:hypothetical protein
VLRQEVIEPHDEVNAFTSSLRRIRLSKALRVRSLELESKSGFAFFHEVLFGLGVIACANNHRFNLLSGLWYCLLVWIRVLHTPANQPGHAYS